MPQILTALQDFIMKGEAHFTDMLKDAVESEGEWSQTVDSQGHLKDIQLQTLGLVECLVTHHPSLLFWTAFRAVG